MMNTKVIKISEENRKKALEEAAECIRRGELVAFPTETVYGLGGNALDSEASKKIYAAKGRPSDNPLIVHIAETEDLEQVASCVNDQARKLAEAYWPGPLTMILPKGERVPRETTGGLDTVAIRMPNHELARDLIRQSGCFIAAPSANTSGRPSPTRAEHVEEDLNGRIAMILDGGPVGIGIESTIVDLTEEVPVILRPGYITPDMIRQVCGAVEVDPALMEVKGDLKPKAPGMKYRHYAPKAEMILVHGPLDRVVAKINALTLDMEAQGKRVGIVCSDETLQAYSGGEKLSLGSRTKEEEIARHLFDGLRKFDASNIDVIYSECFDGSGLGEAVMNRMQKAAGHQIIEV